MEAWGRCGGGVMEARQRCGGGVLEKVVFAPYCTDEEMFMYV